MQHDSNSVHQYYNFEPFNLTCSSCNSSLAFFSVEFLQECAVLNWFNAHGRNLTPTTPVSTSKSQRFFPSSLVLTKLPTIIVDRLKRVSVFPPVVRILYSAFLYPTQVTAKLVYRSSCNLLRILTSY